MLMHDSNMPLFIWSTAMIISTHMLNDQLMFNYNNEITLKNGTVHNTTHR
jgi:hypothetical protein